MCTQRVLYLHYIRVEYLADLISVRVQRDDEWKKIYLFFNFLDRSSDNFKDFVHRFMLIFFHFWNFSNRFQAVY